MRNTMTAVGVCGFGRCGSTMLMRMLDKGGVDPIDGAGPPSYEVPVPILRDLTPFDFSRRAVKLLHMHTNGAMPGGMQEVDAKYVWLDRNPTEQARSFVKWLDANGQLQHFPNDAEQRFRWTFINERPRAIHELANRGELCVLSYEDVLSDPTGCAEYLAEFLAPEFDLDVTEAASQVHDRDPECREDMWEEPVAYPAVLDLSA